MFTPTVALRLPRRPRLSRMLGLLACLIGPLSVTLVVPLTAHGAPGAPGAVKAVPRDHAVPSCLENVRDAGSREAVGDLTILIDQTTYLDSRMRQIVSEAVARLIRPGIQVSVVSFSAFLPGRYLDVVVSGRIETPIAGKQRDYVPKRLLLQTDQCLDEQLGFAKRLVAGALDSAFAATDTSIARSDILAAMHDLGRRIGEAPAETRMLVVVSDMLENSSLASFYRAGQLRVIDAEAEMKHVTSAGIRTDFRGARVFVIGAGLGLGRVAAGQGAAPGLAYRDPRAMLSLEDFWRRWFAANNAELVEFGKPTPLVEIKWPQSGNSVRR